MKNSLLLLAVVALFLNSCSNKANDIEDATSTKGAKEITFSVMNFEQISLDGTRADATALAHIAFGIYDATTMEPIQDIVTQDNGASGYGTLTIKLPYGNYTLVALGYGGSHALDMTDPRAIHCPDGYVPNLFYKTLPLTVNNETAAQQSLVLTRGVAAFSVVCQGDAPSTITSVQIAMQGGSGTFNALTGFATSAEERTWRIATNSSWLSNANRAVTCYTFLTAKESVMNFQVSMHNSSDAVINMRSFDNVPMKINQMSRFTGDFFAVESASSKLSVTLETDQWDEQNKTY